MLLIRNTERLLRQWRTIPIQQPSTAGAATTAFPLYRCCHLDHTHHTALVRGILPVEGRDQAGLRLPAAVEVERHQVDEVEVPVEGGHVVGLADDVVVGRDGGGQHQTAVHSVKRGTQLLQQADNGACQPCLTRLGTRLYPEEYRNGITIKRRWICHCLEKAKNKVGRKLTLTHDEAK